MQFSIRALSNDGRGAALLSLEIEAADEGEVRAQLAGRSLRPVSIVPMERGSGVLGRRDRGFSVLLFSQEFLALVEAGLSVVEALETLAEQSSNSRYRSVVNGLLRSVSQGESLSRALEKSPAAFPALFVGLVRAAESTSNLPQALKRYIDYQGRMDAVRSRLATSAIYPVILLCAGAAVTLFLMTFVVPRFAGVYQGSGRPLPWMSALLLNWGKLVSDHPASLLSAGAAMVAFAGAVTWRVARNGGLIALLGRVPGLGGRMRNYALARLYMTLGMLLEGGITAVQAMQMSRGTVFGAQRDALDSAMREVQSGKPISATFHAHGLAAPVALRFLQVGERSGNLGGMLMRSANYYDAETARWVDRFTRVFEPALMAAIGLVVGLIVVLLYMPIFDLAGSLQ